MNKLKDLSNFKKQNLKTNTYKHRLIDYKNQII